MKQYTWILFFSLFALPLLSNGQQGESRKTKKSPEVTKGYYSMGNHAMRMPARTWIAADAYTSPSVTKGFYSIGNNREKLPGRLSWYPKPGPRPEVTKGYYSIGDHWKKLSK